MKQQNNSLYLLWRLVVHTLPYPPLLLHVHTVLSLLPLDDFVLRRTNTTDKMAKNGSKTSAETAADVLNRKRNSKRIQEGETIGPILPPPSIPQPLFSTTSSTYIQ